MIISLLFGLAAMIVALLGLKCIKIGSTTEESKGKIAGTGGILSILGGESAYILSPWGRGGERPLTVLTLAGFCCIIAVSWYAYRVVQDFYDPFSGGMKSVPAHAAAAAFVLLAHAF